MFSDILKYITISNAWNLFRLLLDIGIVAIIIYYILKIIKNNKRTIQIFKGIVFIFILNGIAQLLGLKTIEYISTQLLNWGVLAFVIIFQPEIRALLEKIGRYSFFSQTTALSEESKERLVDELVKATASLSKTKTGALMSIEQNQSMADYVATGTAMNSVVSSELLGSIFQYGTPLHDGAVIIQGDRIACASAYYPPTSREFPSSYGARHRAAVGISEVCDCITIVVSEETGKISIAKNGILTVMNERELREYLSVLILQKTISEVKSLQEEVKEEKPKRKQVGRKQARKQEAEKRQAARKESFKQAENKVKEENKPINNDDPIESIQIIVNRTDASKEGSDS